MDGTRSALIVANSDYSDAELARLRSPAGDAGALEAVLRDPQIGGFDVRTLLDEPAHVVSLAVEEFFADRKPDDLLVLHFSCHGVKDEDGELYFATANTMLRRLAATAIPAGFVNGRMSRSRSRRIVLLLDCCYAGAFERGMTARAGGGIGVESQFAGRGRAVITASSAMEYAFENDQLADAIEPAPSVFTSALVEGLATGDADRDQDGLIALDELYDYVYDKVRAATPHQTPGKWAFGVQGELVIARRIRPVSTAARLPEALQDALGSPFAGVRGGAVQDLELLLRGRHAGMALAARQALERLTADDSRTVAAAATATLAQSPVVEPLAEPAVAKPAADTPAVDSAPATAAEPGAPTLGADTAVATAPEPALAPLIADTAMAATAGPALATAAADTAAMTAATPGSAAPAADMPGDAAAGPADAASAGVTAEAAPAVSAAEKPADAKARPDAEATDDSAAQSGPAPRPGGGGRLLLLPAGYIALAIGLAITAGDILNSSVARWPWAAIAGVCVLGIAVAAGGRQRHRAAAGVVLANLGWLMVYSLTVLVVAALAATTIAAANILTAEAAAGVMINALLGGVLVKAWSGAAAESSRAVLALLALLAASIGVAQLFAAVALQNRSEPVWVTVGWICILAALGCLVTAACTRRPAADA